MILPLEWRSALHVALYIREIDRVEIEAVQPRYDAIAMTAMVVQFARFGCVAATSDGTPAAVVAATEAYPGVYQVGMYATKDWPKVALGLTKWTLRVMRPALLQAGGHRMECRSIDSHDQAHRWLEMLGAVRECVLPDCGKDRETFFQYAWRLSDGLQHRA